MQRLSNSDTYRRKNLFLVFFFISLYQPLSAQLSMNAINTGLGGGGTAYLTGFEALSVNPANLYFRENKYSLQISILQGGYYFDTLLPITNYNERFNRYRDAIRYHDLTGNFITLNDDRRSQILERSFKDSRLNGEFSTLTDVYWFGLKWIRPERSYAFSFRTRMASRYEIGKGLYSSIPNERNEQFIIDQSLRQQYDVMHELSFGFAESFTFLNGLAPRLSEFIIGASPKIILSGSHIDALFSNRYESDNENGVWKQNLSFRHTSSGVVSRFAEELLMNTSIQQQPYSYTFQDLIKPSGIGAGLDIGITYIITFGEEISVLRNQNEPSEKSLRLSFSVTDLGAVYHYGDPLVLESIPVQVDSSSITPPTDRYFQGSPNEHITFLNGLEGFGYLSDKISGHKSTFDTLLPLSINSGGLLHYRRLKLMGDISYSIVQSSFRPSGFTSYLGFEFRPLRFLPIRGGTRIAPHLQGFYSLGTGIETNRFDMSAAVLLKTKNNSPTSEILGASVVGIRFYL